MKSFGIFDAVVAVEIPEHHSLVSARALVPEKPLVRADVPTSVPDNGGE